MAEKKESTEKKAAPKKDTTAKKVAKMEESKSETTSKKAAAPANSQMIMFGIIAAVVVLIIIAVVGFVVLGNDESVEDFTTYESDDFSIKHPEDWVVSDELGFSIQPKDQVEALENSDISEDSDSGDLFGDLGETTSVGVEEIVDEDVIEAIKNGECEDVANSVLGIEESGDFGFGVEAKNVKSTKLGDDSACSFDASIVFIIEINTKTISVANDESAYSVSIAATGKKSDDFKTAESIQKTFRLK